MAIPVESTMTLVDNMEGEEIEFGISDSRWVMRSLADLYSNKELAVTREYSTNARDSHLAAGKADVPIQVFLPSAFSPEFRVKDFGVGMSEQELKEIYTQFGSSLKRDSNDFNGMLGFGSKSAIAYTTTFTITSIKDGRKTVAVVSRRPDYSIVLKVVATSATTEGNGTEVVVPVHNWQEFAQKAKDFFRFWIPGTVLVNGEEPEHAVGEKITDNLYYSTSGGTCYVVMGGVAYRIANPYALFKNTSLVNINFVAYVENGAVEFTPSREDLKYTDHTNAALHKIASEFEKSVIAKAQSDINSADDFFDAYTKWAEWGGHLSNNALGKLSFRGEELQTSFDINAMRYKPYAHSYSTHRVSNWQIRDMSRTLIITGFKVNLAASHKVKARDFAAHKQMKVNYFLFTEDTKVNSVWVKKDNIISWDSLIAQLPKKPPKPRQYVSGRISGTFDIINRLGRFDEEEVPTTGNIYYLTTQQVKDYNVSNIRGIIETLDRAATAVIVPANRLNKFKRDFPKAVALIDFARENVVVDGVSLLSDKAKAILSLDYTADRWLRSLNPSKINDPELVELINLHKNRDDKTIEAYEKNLALAKLLRMGYNVKQVQSTNADFIQKYRLLSGLSRDHSQHEHIYIYLNAVYAASKKGNQ